MGRLFVATPASGASDEPIPERKVLCSDGDFYICGSTESAYQKLLLGIPDFLGTYWTTQVTHRSTNRVSYQTYHPFHPLHHHQMLLFSLTAHDKEHTLHYSVYRMCQAIKTLHNQNVDAFHAEENVDFQETWNPLPFHQGRALHSDLFFLLLCEIISSGILL